MLQRRLRDVLNGHSTHPTFLSDPAYRHFIKTQFAIEPDLDTFLRGVFFFSHARARDLTKEQALALAIHILYFSGAPSEKLTPAQKDEANAFVRQLEGSLGGPFALGDGRAPSPPARSVSEATSLATLAGRSDRTSRLVAPAPPDAARRQPPGAEPRGVRVPRAVPARAHGAVPRARQPVRRPAAERGAQATRARRHLSCNP